jgi:hypothetical protein
MKSVYDDMAIMGTCFDAIAAVDTSLREIQKFSLMRYRFRVMAPAATVAAAFQENRSPYSGTVVQRKTLYIKY